MIYHIFNSAGVYEKKFVEFLQENSKNIVGKHIFFFINNKSIYTFFKLLKLFLFLRKRDRVVYHSLTNPFLYLLGPFFRFHLKKVTWLVWGGDLYYFINEKNLPLRHRVYEYFRRISIKRFGFISALKDEFTLIQQKYDAKAKRIDFIYPFDLPKLKKLENSTTRHCTSILISHNADEDNNHLEALDALSKYSTYDIKILAVLSYGGTPDYIEKVIQKGIQIFGDKFIPITKMYSKDKYTEFLENIDILSYFMDIQAGVGNIRLLLMRGKKIFIKKGTATCNHLDTTGIKYYYTDDIQLLSFDDFIKTDRIDILRNIDLMYKTYSAENTISILNSFFKTISS